jgi:hypothetical protein
LHGHLRFGDRQDFADELADSMNLFRGSLRHHSPLTD